MLENSETNMDTVVAEYPFFAHAHFLAYAEKKLTGQTPAINQLSPFKQNPILFLNFIHSLDNPDRVKSAMVDTWEDAGSMILDEAPQATAPEVPLPEPLSVEATEDLETTQTNVLEDEFDTAISLEDKKEELHTTVQLVEPTVEPEVELNAEPATTVDLKPAEPVEEALDNVEDPETPDKSLMVMMSFMDWLEHFQHKTKAEQEEEREKKALKTAWQKEKLSAIVEEEEEEIPENIFKQAMESISLESSLISESLAKLLAKQGKTDKAIDMYKKLSLRNPEKSAYFADLIKEIHLNNN
jgi:hypothetical protein